MFLQGKYHHKLLKVSEVVSNYKLLEIEVRERGGGVCLWWVVPFISQVWCSASVLYYIPPKMKVIQYTCFVVDFFLCNFGKKHSPQIVKITNQPWQMRFDYFCFSLNNNKMLSQDYPCTLSIQRWYLDQFHYWCMFIISTCYGSSRSELSLSLKPLIFSFMNSQ